PSASTPVPYTTLCRSPLVTALPAGAYFSHPATLGYLPNNLSLALRQPWLPGVFEATPYGGETNGSLWTLYYEVLCYGAVMVMGRSEEHTSELQSRENL